MTAAGPTDDDGADGRRLLQEAGDGILRGVERDLPGYLLRRVGVILDAWGRLDPAIRAQADEEVRAVVAVAVARVVGELRSLFATDPEQQRSTPLEIVRRAVGEPTGFLASLGVPPVVRDEFEERSWPHDVYGLAPHTLGDLGDPDLAPLHLAWGMAKARVLRARSH